MATSTVLGDHQEDSSLHRDCHYGALPPAIVITTEDNNNNNNSNNNELSSVKRTNITVRLDSIR